MSIGTEIVERTRKTIQDKLEQIEFFQDQIVLVDDQKSLYDQAIFRLDNDLLGEIQIVNRALDDVKDAYQDRISVGCRTDLFWRVTGYNPTPTPDQYTFTCTKLSAGGYEQVGIGSTVRMLNPATDSIVDFPINTYWDEQTGQTSSFLFWI
jgi:hypothetical protein